MPRKPRFYLPDVPVHVVQRGHNREPVFFHDDDYHAYLGWMKEGAAEHGCRLHAYVLMTNHIHLLVTPKHKQSINYMMQSIGRHYVPYINHSYGRSGTLWEGRYKGSLVDAEDYLLTCMRYIELNPVRADMVAHPREYRYSSYRANAEGRRSELVSPHPLYLALSTDEGERRQRYRALFQAHIDEATLSAIRATSQTGTPLGKERFKEHIEQALQVRVGHSRRGRPARAIE